MAKNNITLTYTFVNPNTPKAFENTLKKILIDKLLSQPPKTTFAKSWPICIQTKNNALTN